MSDGQEELEQLRSEVHRLRQSEERYRSVIAAMSEGVVVQTATGEILACNAAAERILGLSADQMAGRTSLDPRWRAIHEDGSPFPGEDHPAMVTLRTGQPCRNVVMGVHQPEGGLSWIEINTEPVAATGDGAPRVVCTFNDMTAYRKVLDDLRAVDERLTLALRAARMDAWELDLDAQHVIARDSYDGSVDGALALVHPDDRARVRAVLDAALADPANDKYQLRHRIVAPDRGERWIEAQARIVRDAGGRATRMVGVAIDITEARRHELEVRQTQRLEAVGRLAGGVAHDFNNVLTAITSAVELASRPGRDPRRELTLIRDAADRAARLTRHLLAFARRQAIGTITVDLGALVNELHPLLGHLLGERIELDVEIAPGTWTVRADQGQLEQVLVNLIANARDAIQEAGRVRVTVGAAANGIAMTVEDDGPGMAPDVLEHVFEPFFTTKATGTGLGLATSYGIVEQHGGHIEIQSTVGKGTRIEVRLPRSDEPVAPAPRPVAAPAARGGETLLLVEDDPAIRSLAESILAEQGYRLLVAGDGIEALEIANLHLDEISLVLTDVVMPRLGGVALVRRLRVRRPDLPALLLSGYAADANATASDLPALDKPYTPASLLREVRGLLDRARPGAPPGRA